MMPENEYLDKVAGMVTLYNSADSVLDRIHTYVDQVGKLYVVDNSEVPNQPLVAQLTGVSDRVVYLRNDGNLGLGVSLNRAAQQALTDGFAHLLMMDDDSALAEGAVGQLYATAVARSETKVGIVSAAQTDISGRQRRSKPTAESVVPVLTAITAGSLLNLAAYRVAGPFQDDLFIDWVDIEYSFRLKKYGYQLLLDPQARIIHRIGIRQQTRLLGVVPYRWRSHGPLRLYYKFRNSALVLKREGDNVPPDFRWRFRWELLRNVIQILLAEPNKGEFFTLIRKALRDARIGQLGKIR